MAQYTAEQLKDWSVSTPNLNGKWVPARPENYRFDGLRRRLKLAWKVFTGKLDAIDWQQDKYAAPESKP